MPNAQKRVINVAGVPADLLKQAQDKAKKEDRSLSQVIRELLRKWLQSK